MRFRSYFAALALSCAAPVLAGGAGPMWVFPVIRLCVAQDAAYADTFLGRWIAEGRLRLKSPEFTQCARKKQWIPKYICADLMARETEESLSRRNLERLGASWSEDLKVLEVAGAYVQDASEAELAERQLPACP
ncbi:MULTISPECIES: hypothetical protein [unclassified Roseateles]|uniref:hypothetical protein n=1 Tax=Pelomonas sp. Root1237 TaxID=1736434 RepID=UPI0012F8BFC9|nr:hypothetical protein [Pelomonas sp. Root1237]